jgi:hypothetical protein
MMQDTIRDAGYRMQGYTIKIEDAGFYPASWILHLCADARISDHTRTFD